MTGIELIEAERQRQIDVEKWTPEHDDQHKAMELAEAGSCYLDFALYRRVKPDPKLPPLGWPWDASWWKPSGILMRNLVKAGALIAAEIDRRLRSGGEQGILEQQVEADMRVQERSLAYENCSGVIDAMTLEDEDGWLDIAEEKLEAYEIDAMQSSVAYLEWRGLVERHPVRPHMIKIRDESEASR